MIVNEDGSVSGSLDRAQLLDLHNQAADDELKAYYRDLLGDSDEGWDADNPEPEGGEPAEDLSGLKKAELVEKAEAAGIDTTGATKADIVAALEGVTDGDDNVS